MDDSFVYHLEELRKRIIRIIIYIVIFAILSFVFSLKILEFIKKPIGEIYFFSPQEAFLARIKISVLCAILLSFPFIIRELWLFIRPGLYDNEIKAVKPFVIFSPLLFYIGSFFSLFVIYPLGVKVLISFAGKSMSPMINVSGILNFVLYLTLFTAILFELPVIVIVLVKLDIVDYEFLKGKRKEVIVAIFILSALLTPSTDFITMSILAIPVVLLYEITLFIAKRAKK